MKFKCSANGEGVLRQVPSDSTKSIHVFKPGTPLRVLHETIGLHYQVGKTRFLLDVNEDGIHKALRTCWQQARPKHTRLEVFCHYHKSFNVETQST